jgi:hypothetical protein
MTSSFWAATRAFDLKTIAYGGLIVLFGPALLFFFPALPFANDGHCDPWYVYGLYFNLPEQVYWTPDLRQIGRLTETLPGYFLTYIFSGVAPNIALFLLFFTTAIIFLYKTAALLFSRERAVLAATFFALSPMVIGNYAVTYSGPGITYETLALYCATRAVSSRLRQLFGWMFLSGIAWGAGLHAHLAVLVFGSFIYLLFAVAVLCEFDRNIRARIGTVAVGAAATLSGLFALTAALSVFAVVAWGAQHGSIVLNQVEHVPVQIVNNATLYWKSDWYLKGPDIGISLFGFGAAAIGTVAHSRNLAANRGTIGSAGLQLATTISFAITLMLLVANESLHGVFLQFDYYYVFIWPFLALTIFATEIDRGVTKKFPFVFVFAVACFVGVGIKQYAMPEWTADFQTVESVVLALVAIVLLLTVERTPRASLFGGYLLVVALSTLVVRPHGMGSQLWEENNSTDQRHSYARINSGLKFLARLFAKPELIPGGPKFWIDDDNVSDAFPYSVSYLSCRSHPFPNIDTDLWDTQRFESGDVLVIVARAPNLLNRARPLLNGLKLEPIEMGSKTIADEDGGYEILVVRLGRMQSR